MQINLTIVYVLPQQISGCLEMRQRHERVRLQRGANKIRGVGVMTIFLILTVVVVLRVYTCVRTD